MLIAVGVVLALSVVVLIAVFAGGGSGGGGYNESDGRAALEAARPLSFPYLSETSSILKLVGRLTSLVARNWTRTVWPRQAARLNDFCE